MNSATTLTLNDAAQSTSGSSLPGFNKFSNSYHTPNHSHRNTYPLSSSSSYYEQYTEPNAGLPSYLMNPGSAARSRLPSASASLSASKYQYFFPDIMIAIEDIFVENIPGRICSKKKHSPQGKSIYGIMVET